MTKIQLSDNFTFKKLFKFVLPTVIMMIVTSVYGVIDGFFVSNFAGKTPFAAINLIMPFLMILGGMGFMIGTGGAALVSKTLGENDREKANRYFTMMIIFAVALAQAFAILLARLFVGYDGELYSLTVYAFRIFSFSFIFSGIAIFSSGFFTALNNGLASAILSFLRALIFQVAFVFLLPYIFGQSGIWWAAPSTELSAFLVAIAFFIAYRKRYQYL